MLRLHGGSPKPGTDSNEIHTKQVFRVFFGIFQKFGMGIQMRPKYTPRMFYNWLQGYPSIPSIPTVLGPDSQTARQPDTPQKRL